MAFYSIDLTSNEHPSLNALFLMAELTFFISKKNWLSAFLAIGVDLYFFYYLLIG
jgi:hypothetical protein